MKYRYWFINRILTTPMIPLTFVKASAEFIKNSSNFFESLLGLQWEKPVQLCLEHSIISWSISKQQLWKGTFIAIFTAELLKSASTLASLEIIALVHFSSKSHYVHRFEVLNAKAQRKNWSPNFSATAHRPDAGRYCFLPAQPMCCSCSTCLLCIL